MEQDLKILTLYARDYAASYSIHQITQKLKLNYSYTFKRIKSLVKLNILTLKKEGQSNKVSLNSKNLDSLRLIGLVEQQEVRKMNNPQLELLAKEALQMDPFCCIGLFGSRVSGKANKDSDWAVFILCSKSKIKQMGKILSKLPYLKNIQLQIFSEEEFQESLASPEETVIKHMIRNKLIIYNHFPFYNLISYFERIKYAPAD